MDYQVLAYKAYKLRLLSLRATTAAGSGHLSSCLSAADLVSALFFYAMEPDDRFILSKGHAAPLLYAAWAESGALTEAELLTLRQFDSVLEGHPTARFACTEAATGSLGMGLSIGAGFACGSRIAQKPFYTYVLMGDAEVAEGSVWEAAEIAAYYKLHNLIAILDVNRLGQSTQTMAGFDIQQYVAKFQAFGFHVLTCNGHDMHEIVAALDAARKVSGKPTIIIAKTYKGYGLELMQDKEGWHGKALPKEQLPAAEAELAKRFNTAMQYTQTVQTQRACSKPIIQNKSVYGNVTPKTEKKEIATRVAYGEALQALGAQLPHVVALDADVKNSTYAELFAKAYPDRFIECFIAEQNMVGMAIGLARLGFIPFVSTFGCFFSRAHDQIRMAAIGQAPLRLVGSHAGVSIGQDGPSQMALEDIALMRGLPNSVVLYPADAVSTAKLVALMANYHEGVSYLRTTRGATPVIYDEKREFKLGGLQVLRQSAQDVACIVAAGVTLFEALKAHDMLAREGIAISVVDCYSIKPLPVDALRACAQKAGRVITVEDHYAAGGLGEAVATALSGTAPVTCLAVTKLPRSGTPEELRSYEEIDAAAIVKTVKKL